VLIPLTARNSTGTPESVADPITVIRWHLHNSLIVIPKSAAPSRIAGNFRLLDFGLGEVDLSAIAELNSNNSQIGRDPTTEFL
jgi:diketogulonate reductase-like aldo/keto reductase